MPEMPDPFPTSVCHGCRKSRRVESGRGSVFLRCTEPALPKYQSQPILECAHHEPVPPADRG